MGIRLTHVSVLRTIQFRIDIVDKMSMKTKSTPVSGDKSVSVFYITCREAGTGPSADGNCFSLCLLDCIYVPGLSIRLRHPFRI